MNIPKLNEAIEILKTNLGESLIAATITMTVDGQSVAGYNSNPKLAAVMVKLVKVINDATKAGSLPQLAKYATLDLQEDKVLVILPQIGRASCRERVYVLV